MSKYELFISRAKMARYIANIFGHNADCYYENWSYNCEMRDKWENIAEKCEKYAKRFKD